MMSRGHSPASRMVAMLMVLALVAAACGGGTSEETTTTAAGAETTNTAGGDETTTTEATSETESTGGGTLTIAWPWDPGTMDPQMHRQRYAQIVSKAMRDSLYASRIPSVERIPWLGDGLVQIDDTTYEMTLREGILFHNGDELGMST